MFLVKLKNGKEIKCVLLERFNLETTGEFLRFLTIGGKRGNIYQNQAVNWIEIAPLVNEGKLLFYNP